MQGIDILIQILLKKVLLKDEIARNCLEIDGKSVKYSMNKGPVVASGLIKLPCPNGINSTGGKCGLTKLSKMNLLGQLSLLRLNIRTEYYERMIKLFGFDGPNYSNRIRGAIEKVEDEE